MTGTFVESPPRLAAATHCRKRPDTGGHAGAFDGLAELQSTLGYGTSNGALQGVEIELFGSRGVRRLGRVEALAPMDLLGEFREPVGVGDLLPIRLRSPMFNLRIESLGLVHWQRSCGGRWLVGLFLREPLPQSLLQHVWMDMRKELRFPTRLRLQVRCGTQRGRSEALLCDYSRSGAKLECVQRPPLGQRLELFDGELLAIGVVRFTAPAGREGTYYVGCEFANNEGVRLSRLAVSLVESSADAWASAETWSDVRSRN